MNSEIFFDQYKALDTAVNQMPGSVVVISQRRGQNKPRVVKGIATTVVCVLHIVGIVIEFSPLY
jgi:hypothetical protein